MARLLLIRHGQASFFGPSYDRLSEQGHAQAQALGAFWARAGFVPRRVYYGPRQRHHETATVVAATAAENGISWPEPVRREELDEHQGIAVVKRLTGHGSPDDDAIHDPVTAPQQAEELKRLYFRRYREIITRWASGEVSVQGLESWCEFRARAARGLEQLTMPDAGAETGAAFTSGGFIAAAVGDILGLDDHRVVELSLVIQNCSVTEIRYSGKRRTLVALNQVPDAIGMGLASFV